MSGNLKLPFLMVDEKDILLKNEMFSPSCCFKPV